MRRPRHRLQVSTFPFLAVLLCTMGSLILVLLVMDRRARAAARVRILQAAHKLVVEEEAVAAARKAEWERRRAALHVALEEQVAQAHSQLDAVQHKAEDTSASIRAAAARLRALRERLLNERTTLTKTEQALGTQKTALAEKTKLSEAAQAQLRRLAADLDMLERVLADLKAARQRQQSSYSVVPYRGKHGDVRKPLYIECSGNGLLFHPDRERLDGYILSPLDIRGMLERRLERHRLVALKADPKEGKPYLLMLLRPSGIANYYRTLSAMAGLDVDFGYELVDEDWTFDFPDDDREPPVQPWMSARVANPGTPERQVSTTMADGTHLSGQWLAMPGTGNGPGGSGGVASGVPLIHRGVLGGGTFDPYHPSPYLGGLHGPGDAGPSRGFGPGGPGSGPRTIAQAYAGLFSGGASPGPGGPFSGPGRPYPGPGGPGAGPGGPFPGPGGANPGTGGPSSGPGGPNAGTGPNGASNGPGSRSPGTGNASLGPGGTGTGPGGAGPGGSVGTPGGNTLGKPGNIIAQAGVPSAIGPGGAPGTLGNGNGTSGPGGGLDPIHAPLRSGPGGPGNGNAGTGAGMNGNPGAGVNVGSGSGSNGVPESGTGQRTAGSSSVANGNPGSGNGNASLNGSGTGTGNNESPPVTAWPNEAARFNHGGSSGGTQGPGVGGSGEASGAGAEGGSGGSSGGSSAGGAAAGSGAAASAVESGVATPGSNPPAGGPTAGGGGIPRAPGTTPDDYGPPSGPPADPVAGFSPGGSGGGPSGGAPSRNDGPPDPFNRLSPPVAGGRRSVPSDPRPPERYTGNRDFIIRVECNGEGIVCPAGGAHQLSLSALQRGDGTVQLQKLVREMIERRQATVRPGEVPFRVQVRFLIRPDGQRSYYLAWPALEALQVPMTCANIGRNDSVEH